MFRWKLRNFIISHFPYFFLQILIEFSLFCSKLLILMMIMDSYNYSAQFCHSVIILALNHYYPGFSPAAIAALEHYQVGIIDTGRYPFTKPGSRETNYCVQNVMSKGIRTERELIPRPSDYESRARPNTLQCSHF